MTEGASVAVGRRADGCGEVLPEVGSRTESDIGSMWVDVTFSLDAGGRLLGVAQGAHETVPLTDPIVEPDDGGSVRVRWTQRIGRPMPLSPAFDLRVTGDELALVSRAGRLPSSAVTGRRVH